MPSVAGGVRSCVSGFVFARRKAIKSHQKPVTFSPRFPFGIWDPRCTCAAQRVGVTGILHPDMFYVNLAHIAIILGVHIFLSGLSISKRCIALCLMKTPNRPQHDTNPKRSIFLATSAPSNTVWRSRSNDLDHSVD